MVHGIEIDNKVYKHKKRDDEKDMYEDMLVWKRYIRRDITKYRKRNNKDNSTVFKNKNKGLTPIRVIEILILFIFGPITLIGGIIAININFIVGLPLLAIGIVFVITLVLNEVYRK